MQAHFQSCFIVETDDTANWRIGKVEEKRGENQREITTKKTWDIARAQGACRGEAQTAVWERRHPGASFVPRLS